MKTRTALEAALRIELEGVDAQLATELLLDLAREHLSRCGSRGDDASSPGADEPLRARFIEVRGERLTMTGWAHRLGIPRRTLHDRVDSEGPSYIERMLEAREAG
jgi:hypothetical protein